MIKLSNYKKRKIAHHYRKSGSIGDTIKIFNISYKDLYKIIEKSKITSYKEEDGITYKRCSSCKNFIEYTEDNFYKRKGTNYLYSSCKKCMGLLAKAYKIINKQKLAKKNNIISKRYYNNNKITIRKKKRKYYNNNRNTILNNKKISYILGKRNFIKKFLRVL